MNQDSPGADELNPNDPNEKTLEALFDSWTESEEFGLLEFYADQLHVAPDGRLFLVYLMARRMGMMMDFEDGSLLVQKPGNEFCLRFSMRQRTDSGSKH